MKQEAMFNEKQPEYRYFAINNERADVFVYKFIKEMDCENEGFEGTKTISHVFVYEVSNISVNPDDVTEEMVKKNPLNYMDYVKPSNGVDYEEYLIDLDFRLTSLELGIE